MRLIKFEQDPVKVVYELRHSTPGAQGTTLSQEITIEQNHGHWKASIEFDGFPDCSDPDAAAAKLGEWMFRMSEEIMDNKDKFSKIDLMNIKNS